MENPVPVNFKAISLKLASPEKILSWSRGEVTKPETINYRTQRAEKDGLFDERIFGPEKDYECYCGKYRRIRYKGIVCDKCGVEVTRSVVRRERMGHIALASPVAHIWFLRGVPSRIGLLFDLTLADLERVIYFAGYIVTSVDEKARASRLVDLEKEFKQKSREADRATLSKLKTAFEKTKTELEGFKPFQILSEIEYHRLSLKYGDVFEADIGAKALHSLATTIDLPKLAAELEKQLKDADVVDQRKIIRRLGMVKGMIRARIRPEWMFITVIPVTPPAFRPMVALDGGRHATSDVNDLYRRVINRNNRLKKLTELGAPEVIVRNEKRMLQEAVDALLDNSIRRGHAAVTSQAQKRALKSLADALRGKQGRFRQNLLGKRVDYSGRSVIVVGPSLKLHQCGIPKHMALELFRPFVIANLITKEFAHNIRGANRLIDEPTPDVWAALEEVIRDKFVLLNRAPTLHRLGVQAFQPVLIEGNAIQVHPLVCQAYNADFDGDQMAVHVPLTEEAQREARELMWSIHNLTKPGTGDPIVNPTQDMVLGIFWLTKILAGTKGEGSVFSSPNEAILASEYGAVHLRARIKVAISETPKYRVIAETGGYVETSVGRLLFNSALPNDFEYVNDEVKKKDLERMVATLIARYGREAVPDILDKIKSFGFKYASISGISWGLDDLRVPQEKPQLIAAAQVQAVEIERQYNEGLLTDEERYKKVVEIWKGVKQKVDSLVPKALDEFGSVFTMVSSAARGNWIQVSQMSGMRGLVLNPSGRIIELPILSNYKEGLKVLEYFISTHGARKGTADTALKTSAAGYLTRRLVDVAQDVIVEEENCKDDEGLLITRREAEDFGKGLASRIFGRVAASDVKNRHEKVIFKRGHLLSFEDAEKVEKDAEIEEIAIRSPMTCKVFRGVCQQCYGYDLGTNELAGLGEAVGIVAAQAIGEPGTQLTMRTFHTGGVAVGGDITMGLPRVEELFEIRTPANPAVLADCNGTILGVEESGRERVVKVLLDSDSKKSKAETKEFAIPFGRLPAVEKGAAVAPGMRLSDGPVDIRQLFSLSKSDEAPRYILNEVIHLYALQGASINPKHVEIIVRQMFAHVRITDAGTTNFAVGDGVKSAAFLEENQNVKKDGGKPAKGEPFPLGITRSALASSSFLAAASFQETTRVLISAALEGRVDRLRGLKENVIIGRLIPAGTGFRKKAEK